MTTNTGLVSVTNPRIQGIVRRLATEHVAEAVERRLIPVPSEMALGDDNSDVTFVSQIGKSNVRVVTERRAGDITRHVRVSTSDGNPILDAVYAEGGNEELEQAMLTERSIAILTTLLR